MVFSSIEFLFYFLPPVLAIYFAVPNKARNNVLLVASLLFYAWGGPWYLILITVQTLVGWLFGLFIDKKRNERGSKLALICSILLGLCGLIYFKYTNFFVVNINNVFSTSISLLKLSLPLGISFSTFQILSYNIDLYKGNIKVQRSFLTFFTYVTLFPQLVAGPIVRYSTIEKELSNRPHSFELFSSGVRRFVIGLAKKVLLANNFAKLTAICDTKGSLLNGWLYFFAFAFQLYFDFSGYSDMAIGLGKLFGFDFLENFNYPYISQSVTEFWRRWHISMGSWFRDYIYIPMGGNRVKLPRYILNVFIVWFATGLWHGAGWNYIVWGLYFALLLLLEKTFLLQLLSKLPRFVRHIYIIICIAVGWTIFDSLGAHEALVKIGILFGASTKGAYDFKTIYYLRSYMVLLLMAFIGCTPIPALLVTKLKKSEKYEKVFAILEPLYIAILLVMTTANLVDGSFNPFIYFKF